MQPPAAHETYSWDLRDLYPSLTAWKENKSEVLGRIAEMGRYQGTLGDSAETLAQALIAIFDVEKDLRRLSVYANLLSDQDVRVGAHQGFVQEIQHLRTLFEESTAFLAPELAAIPSDTLAAHVQEHPGLKDFNRFIANLQRRRGHILPESEERILAGVNSLTDAGANIRSIFAHAELPYPEVELSTGETVTLTPAQYSRTRSSSIREDRRLVCRTFMETHDRFKNTFGAGLLAKLRSDHLFARSRGYASCLQAALDGDNIPTQVYEGLIDRIHQNLPTLHRFLELKRRMLKVDTLHYYDLYAPMCRDVNLDYSIEEAQAIVLKALKPLGPEYIEVLRQAFSGHWIDYLPTPGKRSGAYSNGSAYKAHPYILLNWNGNIQSLGTLAHELGHTVHSYLSNQCQPFPKSKYTIFVAEIASTLNENLLSHFLVDRANSAEERLFLLGRYLEVRRGTLFRQTLFAEFEWELHKNVERGEPVTGEGLSRLYLELVRRYYGHHEGICLVDPEVAHEWAFIPHFYYNFYMYKYATSLIYSTALAENILNHDPGALDRYLTLLRSGVCRYSLDLIRDAGIDPLSPEPFEMAMQKMNAVMEEMEESAGAS